MKNEDVPVREHSCGYGIQDNGIEIYLSLKWKSTVSLVGSEKTRIEKLVRRIIRENEPEIRNLRDQIMIEAKT